MSDIYTVNHINNAGTKPMNNTITLSKIEFKDLKPETMYLFRMKDGTQYISKYTKEDLEHWHNKEFFKSFVDAWLLPEFKGIKS